MKVKIQLKEESTYHNPHNDEDMTITKIYDRQVDGAGPRTLEKRVQYVTAAGIEREADYEMIRSIVQKVINDKTDYENTLGAVFNSNEYFDNDEALFKFAKNGHVRVQIHPRDRDKLADEYSQMTGEEVDSKYVDECPAQAVNSNWAISYSIRIKQDKNLAINPNLKTCVESGQIVIRNNEMLRLLFEMGFKLGKKHDVKRIRKCMKS
jgi:hypothetical protein